MERGTLLPAPGSLLQGLARPDNVNWPITYSHLRQRKRWRGGRRRRGGPHQGTRRGRRARDAPDVSSRSCIDGSSRVPYTPPTRLQHSSASVSDDEPEPDGQSATGGALRRDLVNRVARVGGTAAIPSTSSRGASHPGSLPTVALDAWCARLPRQFRNPIVYRSGPKRERDSTLTSRPPLPRTQARARDRAARARRRCAPARGAWRRHVPARATAGCGTWRARGLDCAGPRCSSELVDRASRRRRVTNPRAIRDDRLETDSGGVVLVYRVCTHRPVVDAGGRNVGEVRAGTTRTLEIRGGCWGASGSCGPSSPGRRRCRETERGGGHRAVHRACRVRGRGRSERRTRRGARGPGGARSGWEPCRGRRRPAGVERVARLRRVRANLASVAQSLVILHDG